ncbi:hypothetical protein MMC20_003297 [Loxospora ochrophaea]|nr:hypothetical protein [Loxospora ochrophaea]
MPDVKRTVRIVTEQKIVDKPSGVEGFPLRRWNISIYLLNENGEEMPANVFGKAIYKLHPSFEKRANQTFNAPPFRISEEGWGEFDMQIVLTAQEKGGEFTLSHDLNFASDRYEAEHAVTFKNPKPALMSMLGESGKVPGEENGVKKKGNDAAKKRKSEKGVDMEKLADNLQNLDEDDLLQVVQLVHDHKTQETYTKNDVDSKALYLSCARFFERSID